MELTEWRLRGGFDVLCGFFEHADAHVAPAHWGFSAAVAGLGIAIINQCLHSVIDACGWRGASLWCYLGRVIWEGRAGGMRCRCRLLLFRGGGLNGYLAYL